MTAKDAMRVYDLLREAHKSIKQVWREFPELIESGDHLETVLDVVDKSLYVAEGIFVRESEP